MPTRPVRMIAEGLLLLSLLAGLAWYGTELRQQLWSGTEALRYAADMDNGWTWGSRAARDGFFPLYDRVVAETEGTDYVLDYLPLRLAVMTVWAKHELVLHPTISRWQSDYAFNRPLLWFNETCEALTALGLGLIAFDWQRRDRRPTLLGEARPLYGGWLALLVIAAAWLNPASLVSAHIRPTWDVWVTPFYVWAMFAATRRAWMTAGCIVGVGAMLKGQQLFTAPLFLLWPLMRFRFGAAMRFAVGFAVSVAMIASPWLVGQSARAIIFVVAATIIPVSIWAILQRWPLWSRRMPARWLGVLVPTALAASIVLCVPLFGGSINWLRLGLIYGADKFKDLTMGGDSLAGLLQHKFHWHPMDRVETLQPLWQGVTISQVLIGLYAVCLLLIAFAASQYERRPDRRFVLAVAAPWLVYFALFPKVHERYLLWGATVACIGVVVHSGLLGLAIFFTLCQTAMSLSQLIDYGQLASYPDDPITPVARMVGRIANPLHPGIGWAVVLATAIWLWITLAGTIKRGRRPAIEAVGPDDLA